MTGGTVLAQAARGTAQMKKNTARRSGTRILRREESLSSRQYRGISIRVIYECDALEILRVDMAPGSVLDDRDIAELALLHVVIGGSPEFNAPDENSVLFPGDSIALREGQTCRVSNPTYSRSSILSFLFKRTSACHSASAFGRAFARKPDTGKEISR
jgi:hypothetical protein